MNPVNFASVLNSALFITLLTSSVFAQSSEDKRPVRLEDRGDLRYPGPPSISPDGRQVAYAEDGTIFVIDSTGNEPVAVTTDSGSAWSPVWSKDGSSLYFVSDRGDKNQIWSLPMAAPGEARATTSYDRGISSINFSPDESRLLVVFSDDALIDEAEDPESPPPPFVVTRRQFKRDSGKGYLTAGSTRHLYVYDIETRELKQITAGSFNEGDGAWSPDGKSIVFVSNREPQPDASYRTDIWLLALSDEAANEPRQITDNDNSKYSPSFSPDGTMIAYLSAGDGVYSVPHVALIPASGGTPRFLTKDLDRWITGYEFSANGKWIYVSFDNAGSSHLARVRLSDGRIERIIDGEISVGAFDVGPGSSVALNASPKQRMTDVHRLDGRRLTRLTDLNRHYLEEIIVSDKRKIAFESADGTPVEAFITVPHDYEEDRAYPTILNIHGGPVGQFDWAYAFRSQFLAANGYVVVEPNPRGSSGFGEDYIRAIYRTWGVTDYDDIIAAIDYAVEQKLSDPDRLAVTGYSYGGYMTNVVITSTDRFKAAASGAGHSLIEANFGHDIYQQWYLWELGVPWENRERYDRLSPFLRAGNAKTPTLFLGGRIDWNVPIINAELMFQAMKVRGVDTELVVYPGVHHGGWPDEYESDYLQRIVTWFDRYTKL
ncbi:MAG: S9 family peptidase [Woeseiaceae bacterium]